MDGIIKQNKQKIEENTRQPDTKYTEEKIITSIRWEAPEYEFVPKTDNWFWSVGIIAVGISTASALLGNFLFAILVMLFAFTLVIYGARRPKKIIFSLTSRGIQIEKKLYPYESIDSFWIHYNPPREKHITIDPKKIFMPTISIPLEEMNPNEIREYLLKFLKEERHEEPITKVIMRILGF